MFVFFTADFGLAKQKNPDASKMTSMVGTILYSWYVQTFLSLYMENDLEVEFRFLAASVVKACVPGVNQVNLR